MPAVSSILSSSCLVTAAAVSCRQSLSAAAAAATATTKSSTSSSSSSSPAAVVGGHGHHQQQHRVDIGGEQQMKTKSNIFNTGRRELLAAVALVPAMALIAPVGAALAEASDEEYVQETSDVIKKVRTTIGMEKSDPAAASAVAELRDASNSWVAKYRREKALLGRASFRDMYSALNAVSGHYISFGPTAPIPAKRKARILEEVDTAEKALLRGR